MSGARRLHGERILFLSAFALAFAFAVVFPVAAIIREILFGHGFAATMFDPLVLAIVRATIGQAAASTAIALVLGFPLGLWLASSSQRRGLELCQRLLALPFGLPTLVAVTAWVAIFGRQGLLASWGWEVDILYSWAMVVFAHVFFNIPYVALLVSEARSQISETAFDNLRMLGANRWQRFRILILPRCRPALFVAGVQVFNLCTMSFAIVLILGGGPPVATMETAIYERLRLGAFDLTSAAACAVWQLLINLIPALLLVSRFEHAFTPTRSTGPRVAGRWRLRHAIAVIACAGFILPYFSFFDGLTTGDLLATMTHPDVLASLSFSLRLAALTSLCALTLATLATATIHMHRSHTRLARLLLTISSLPAGISALVLGVGVWLAYGAWIDPFSGNVFLIAAIQATLFFPLVFRILLANLSGYQKSSIELLQCLGAHPLKAFYFAEWPRWRRPLVAAVTIALGASMAEISAVVLFAGEGTSPLPVVIQRMLSQYRFAEAQGATALLFLTAMTLMLVASRYGHGGVSRD